MLSFFFQRRQPAHQTRHSTNDFTSEHFCHVNFKIFLLDCNRTVMPFISSLCKIDFVSIGIGGLVLLVISPLLVLQIVIATIWEIVDVKIVKFQKLCAWFNVNIKVNVLHGLVREHTDHFMMNVLILNGILFPFYLIFEGMWVIGNDGRISFVRLLLYHVLRFGPNVSNFAYVNTLIHKECHGRIFKPSQMNHVFEYIVGPFHGILPGNYSLAHVYIHHKYDNSIEDITTVIDFPRDSFINFLGYSYRYLLYSLNLSTIVFFYNTQQWKKCRQAILCTVYYLGFLFSWAYFVSPTFAIVYLFYPVLQSNFIISAINYTWHAFIQPGDAQNRHINSTTIYNGEYFILEEEYHAIHHLYAGVHWTKHKTLYERHLKDCKTPTCFYNINVFELWGMIVFRSYDKLAENAKIDKALLVQRLQFTSPGRVSLHYSCF